MNDLPRPPGFLIIGAAKAATTSLSSLLGQHPEVGMSPIKEPHFFSSDARYGQGWHRYLGLYAGMTGKRMLGEASTSYSRLRQYPRTLDRIVHHAPDVKVIYMVRHPIHRMESAYIEHLCTAHRPAYRSINDAIEREPMLVDSSRYWETYDAYRRTLGEARVMVIWFEDYVARPGRVFAQVCMHLGIDAGFMPDLAQQRMHGRDNAADRMRRIGRGHVPIDLTWAPHTRHAVMQTLRDDTTRLLRHFGKPHDFWPGLI